MGGGREIPICISIAAIVGIGMGITNANSIVPKSNFFILLPPLLIRKRLSVPYILSHLKGNDYVMKYAPWEYGFLQSFLDSAGGGVSL